MASIGRSNRLVLKSGGVNQLTVVGLDIGDIARSKKSSRCLKMKPGKAMAFWASKVAPPIKEEADGKELNWTFYEPAEPWMSRIFSKRKRHWLVWHPLVKTRKRTGFMALGELAVLVILGLMGSKGESSGGIHASPKTHNSWFGPCLFLQRKKVREDDNYQFIELSNILTAKF